MRRQNRWGCFNVELSVIKIDGGVAYDEIKQWPETDYIVIMNNAHALITLWLNFALLVFAFNFLFYFSNWIWTK